MRKKIGIFLIIVLIVTGCSKETLLKDIPKQEKNIVVEEDTKQEVEQENATLISDDTEVSNEDELVSYLNEVSSDVFSITNNNLTEKEENTLKDTFVSLTDFIFYGGSIKGMTFSELSDQAKDKVLTIYENIDQYIESKIPNYKEKITSGSKKIYTNLKQQVVQIRESIKNQYKDQVGDEAYNETVDAYLEDKKNLEEAYEPYKPVVDKAKEKTKETYSNIKDKISTWWSERGQ